MLRSKTLETYEVRGNWIKAGLITCLHGQEQTDMAQMPTKIAP